MALTTQDASVSRRTAGWLPLVAVCLGYFLVILDVTVVNVALPVIGTGLRTGVTGLQWVVDGYTLTFAGLILFCGGLGDRFGGKPVFLTGLAVFTLTSACCGLAPSPGVLIGARLVQGAGAALMVPASLALLRHAYPDRRSRARAFGAWGMVAGTAAAAGPVLGGMLVSAAGWRSVFFINLPFGILGFVLTGRHVPSPAPGSREPETGGGPHPPVQPSHGLDLPAQLSGALCLGALTTGLIEAGTLGWASPVVLAGLGLSVLALGVFLPLERRARAPMLPLELFASRRFSASAVTGVLLNLGFYGLLFVVPLYFERVRHLGALGTGLAMLPMAAMPMISSLLGGRLAASRGARLPMTAGLTIGGIGLLGWLLAGSGTGYALLIVPMMLTGFGTGFAMPAATLSIMEAAPAERGGAASAVFNAARQTGSAIGVGLTGSLASASLVTGLHWAALAGGIAFGSAAALTAIAIRLSPGARHVDADPLKFRSVDRSPHARRGTEVRLGHAAVDETRGAVKLPCMRVGGHRQVMSIWRSKVT
jgi:DHA2 family methylenomycin A resistance protein-like MFS transporter